LPGSNLHSRYNPQAEAARYVDSLNLKSGIECFILIEPGLGYLVPVLREKFKDSKIIALHVDENLPAMQGVPTLYGEDCTSLQNFLESEVPQTSAKSIRIIEWRPSMNYYGEAYVKLLSQVVEFIKRADAGKRTESAFGKRWVRNFFKNLEIVQKTLLYKTSDIPVIITGSGPSLEKALPLICEAQDNCLIIAASSSIMALGAGGVKADIVIATDGGPWALKHIYPCFRNTTADSNDAKNAVGFAVNLCAALPSQCSSLPFLLINDSSFWQSVILHELALPSVIIPQRGTVSATAVDLALALSGGNIYLAGMDLSVKDIRTHARPYGFDHLLFDKAGRFSPVYSQSFIRSGLLQKGGGLSIYEAWFKNQLSSWPKRIFSIGGGNEVFEDAICAQGAVKKTGEYFKTNSVNGDFREFRKRGEAALLTALGESRFADNIKAELTPLLFPDEKKASENMLREAILSLSANSEGEIYG